MIDQTINTLMRLFPIPSRSGDEGELSAFVDKLFTDLGFTKIDLPLILKTYQYHPAVKKDDQVYSRSCPNLLFTIPGHKDLPHLILNAHLDTFHGTGASGLQISHNKITGDGQPIGADCKLGIALIYSFCRLLTANPVFPAVDVLLDSCEEPGLIGMHEFIDNKLYNLMPGVSAFRKGKTTYSFSFDGPCNENDGDYNFALTRQNALSLVQLLNGDVYSGKILAVKGERIVERKISRKERATFDLFKYITKTHQPQECYVHKFGTSFVLFSKIIPTTLVSTGCANEHSPTEMINMNVLRCLTSKLESLFSFMTTRLKSSC